MQIAGPSGKAPKNVKVFANIPNTLDFDKAQNSEPIQMLDFEEDTLQHLKFVKFQNVKNLTLFVENNQEGGELTIIDDIKLYGQPLSGATNMDDFKRVSLFVNFLFIRKSIKRIIHYMLKLKIF